MVLDHFHLKQFADEGYVVVRSLLDGELDLQPVQDEYDEILDRLITKWHAEGRLRSTYAGLPFADRLMRSVVEVEDRYDLDFDISLPQINITDATPMHHGPAVFNLLRSPRLLDAVERFIRA
jgi:phytanoyl-CoA hydroxylase